VSRWQVLTREGDGWRAEDAGVHGQPVDGHWLGDHALVAVGEGARTVLRLWPEDGTWRTEEASPAATGAASRVTGMVTLPDGNLAVALSEWRAYELRVLAPDGTSLARVADVGAGHDLALWGDRIVIGLNGTHVDRGAFPEPPHRSPGGIRIFRWDGEALHEEPSPDCAAPCRGSQVVSAQLDGVGPRELLADLADPVGGRRVTLYQDDAEPLSLHGLELIAAMDLDDDGRDELLMRRDGTFVLLGVEGADDPPPIAASAHDIGPAPETRTADAWSFAALLAELGLVHEAEQAFLALEALGGVTATAARLERARSAEARGDLEQALAAWRTLADEAGPPGDTARAGLDRWALVDRAPGLTPWALDQDTGWTLTDPFRSTRLPPGRLRIADGGPTFGGALRPVVLGSEHAELRYRLRIDRTEWSAGVDTGLFAPGTRPSHQAGQEVLLGIKVSAQGGGGVGLRYTRCTGSWLDDHHTPVAEPRRCDEPQVDHDCVVPEASTDQQVDVRLAVDPSTGQTLCELRAVPSGLLLDRAVGTMEPVSQTTFGGIHQGVYHDGWIAEVELSEVRSTGWERPDEPGDPVALALALDRFDEAAAGMPPGFERDLALALSGDQATTDRVRRVAASVPATTFGLTAPDDPRVRLLADLVRLRPELRHGRLLPADALAWARVRDADLGTDRNTPDHARVIAGLGPLVDSLRDPTLERAVLERLADSLLARQTPADVDRARAAVARLEQLGGVPPELGARLAAATGDRAAALDHGLALCRAAGWPDHAADRVRRLVGPGDDLAAFEQQCRAVHRDGGG